MEQYSPEQLSAFWSGVSGVATAIAAAVAVFTLNALRQDSTDRSRPVMTASLQRTPLTKGSTELVVRNEGAGVARNVRVTFDPPLPELEGAAAEGKVTPFLTNRYRQPVRTITPRMRLSNLYYLGVPGEAGRYKNAEPLPDQVEVQFEYEDVRGRSYSDSYSLDIAAIRFETWTGPSNRDEAGQRRRELNAMETIARALHRL